MYRVLTFVGIPTAFLLGFSLHVPDVETPFHKTECEAMATRSAMTSHPEIRQQLEKLGIETNKTQDMLIRMMERESNSRPVRRPLSLVERERLQRQDDQELKVIECSQGADIPIHSCDCWINNRCEKPQTRRERFRQCYDQVDDRNTCDCWTYNEAPQGTLCRLFYRRDRCKELETLELREECWSRWQHEKIPRWLYGSEAE